MTFSAFRGIIRSGIEYKQGPNHAPIAVATGANVFTIDLFTADSGNAARVIAMVLLVIYVVAKEIAIATPDRRAQSLGRIVDVGFFPLLFVSGVVIVTEVVL